MMAKPADFKTIPTAHQIPNDIPKIRQPSRSAAPPSIPRHLSLAEEERGHLQTHLDLVGIDRYRFEHTAEDQSK